MAVPGLNISLLSFVQIFCFPVAIVHYNPPGRRVPPKIEFHSFPALLQIRFRVCVVVIHNHASPTASGEGAVAIALARDVKQPVQSASLPEVVIEEGDEEEVRRHALEPMQAGDLPQRRAAIWTSVSPTHKNMQRVKGCGWVK